MIAAAPGSHILPALTEAPSGSTPAQRGEILLVTVERREGSTGVNTHARALREGFVGAGFGCTVVNPFGGSRLWLPVFAARRGLDLLNKTWGTLWYRRWHYAALYRNLLRHLSIGHPAAVIAQCPLSAQAALEARRITHSSFPIAMVCHFNYSEATEYRDKGALSSQAAYEAILELERQVLTRVDRVIYVSSWAQRTVEQDRDIHPKHGQVIWNGIVADPGPRSLARSELGLSHDDLVLINVGTLEPRKNQVGLIELFEKIAVDCPAARLVLVGDGPDRARIARAVADKGLTDRVHLLGTRRDVPALLQLADVYIHYSKLENCPVAILEAARAGLPSAAIPAGGIPELANQLGSIVALDPDDLSNSLAALRPLLNDPAERAELGRRGSDRFQRHFTREAMAGAYLRALGLDQIEGRMAR